MDRMPNHVKCPEATPKHPAHQRVEAAKEPDAVALKISSAAAWHLQLQAATSEEEQARAGASRVGGSNRPACNGERLQPRGCPFGLVKSPPAYGKRHLPRIWTSQTGRGDLNTDSLRPERQEAAGKAFLGPRRRDWLKVMQEPTVRMTGDSSFSFSEPLCIYLRNGINLRLIGSMPGLGETV